jgi:hypothetical protein
MLGSYRYQRCAIGAPRRHGEVNGPDPQWFPVLEGIPIYNYLFMSRLRNEVGDWGNKGVCPTFHTRDILGI